MVEFKKIYLVDILVNMLDDKEILQTSSDLKTIINFKL